LLKLVRTGRNYTAHLRNSHVIRRLPMTFAVPDNNAIMMNHWRLLSRITDVVFVLDYVALILNCILLVWKIGVELFHFALLCCTAKCLWLTLLRVCN